MKASADSKPFIAIACGGTGGHLFPGLVVAQQLQARGCGVALLVSPKEVDQQAVKSVSGMEIFTLPAVGLQNGNYFSFAGSFWNSFRTARNLFRQRRPAAVLAMGGFTSAPPVFAAKLCGAKTFLHESNTIPGRANRLLARFVDAVFISFPEAAGRLRAGKISVTGTPVRPQFWWDEAPDEPAREDARSTKVASCRLALGLEPDRPTILVVGGSQGARGLNDLVLSALPLLKNRDWQWLHLAGANDFEKVKSACAANGIRAVVKPFFSEMDLALGAATAAISRAGASSLAEMAALRLPSLLVPLPTAADNHQFFNASAFAASGAAKMLEQKSPPEKTAALLAEIVGNKATRQKIQSALAQWHKPKAAEQIAENILNGLGENFSMVRKSGGPAGVAGQVNFKVAACL
jgi:UDP-N-acetylglucosamine--N-acetylmuramyl-(pentapeptide) pyrophosphoryl-undecaprenol N-acetylglucosamine transferase